MDKPGGATGTVFRRAMQHALTLGDTMSYYATRCNANFPKAGGRGAMPVEIEGITYFTQDEVVREVGVSRHTLWRWRRAGAIPTGQLDRRGHVLFTASQVKAIKNYANRVEPAAASDTGQLRLFNNGHKKRGGG